MAARVSMMLSITKGSFLVPLVVAGGICLLGAAAYLFVVGEIAPLPVLEADEKERKPANETAGSA